jgi:hypothetical protein
VTVISGIVGSTNLLVRGDRMPTFVRSYQDVLVWRENRRHSAPDFACLLQKIGPRHCRRVVGVFSHAGAEKGRVNETNVCSSRDGREAWPALPRSSAHARS